jgi:hypothetical protein
VPNNRSCRPGRVGVPRPDELAIHSLLRINGALVSAQKFSVVEASGVLLATSRPMNKTALSQN